MPAHLSEFTPIQGMDGFFTAAKSHLRCTAMALRSGGICLHSPVPGLGSLARSSLDSLGGVEYLLAPNHYHNKGLLEYSKTFPEAHLVAPEASVPRLQKQTGLAFERLDSLMSAMPKGSRFVSPLGLKTGEVWIVTSSGWIVVDAFAGPPSPGGKARLLGTFPSYGVGDKSKYSDWFKGFLETDPPQILVPCHGAIVEDSQLARMLLNLVIHEI